MHNHGHGDFGRGLESTSNIEQLWAHLKGIIKNIYNIIPHKQFILFLREAEFRRNIKDFNFRQKWTELIDVMNYLSNIGIKSLYSEEQLFNID